MLLPSTCGLCLIALIQSPSYIITTGGMGPGHDDITRKCVAEALGVDLELDDRAKELLAKSTEHGMQTLDQSLVKAYQEGKITKDNALRYADSANDVRLRIKMLDRGELGTGEGLGSAFEEEEDEGQFHGR